MNYSIPSLLLVALCLSSCATQQKQSDFRVNIITRQSSTRLSSTPPPSESGEELANAPVQKVCDPFERINRTTFKFNDRLTNCVLRPFARCYVKTIPQCVRTSVSNFFDNLDFPVRFSNDILQGRIVRSAQEAGKFVVNSTIGIGGLYKPSEHVTCLANVPPEDFGLTLGRWGLSPGPYFVAPVIGPSSLRDSAGFAGDYCLNPLNWYQIGIIQHKFISNAANIALGVTKYTNNEPKIVDTYDQVTADAIDPYIAVRNAYLSYRAAQLQK